MTNNLIEVEILIHVPSVYKIGLRGNGTIVFRTI